MLDKLLQQREIYEYWAHAAAFLPMRDYRFSLPYKMAIREGKQHWFKNPDRKLMARLMDQVEREGGLRSRDLEDTRGKPGGWWEWKPAKRALEQLYFEGRLMVSARQGFDKVYDLPERVLPEGVDTRVPEYEEYAAYLLDRQLACHGLVTLKGITYLRRDAELRRATRALTDARLNRGELIALRTANGNTFFAEADLLDTPAPRTDSTVRVLSPFDNAVIQRERLADLFGYDYQIECYVPQARRQFGYFCLPLLYRANFVGRLDCKAHRKTGVLEIFSLHIENEAAVDAHADEFPRALGTALVKFAHFQGCNDIKLGGILPKRYRQPLAQALTREDGHD
eukprot:g15754.t1